MDNKLPEGWKIKKLVQHIPIIKTGVKEYKGEKFYFSTGSVSNGQILPEGKFTFENRPARANRLAIKGDVLQARMQETKKALLIDEKFDGGLFSTGFLQFRPSENNYDSRLFHHYLCSDLFLKQRDEFASGSTQVALTDDGAENIDLIIPPHDQHKYIADKLDILLAKVKDCQTRLDKIPLILKRFRESILAAAFSGDLTREWREKNNLDNEWREVCLGEILNDLKYGTSQKCDKEKKKHPVLRIPNIVKGYVDPDDMKYADLDDKEYEKLKLAEGDILLIRSNGSVSLVGRTAIVTAKERGMAYAGYLIRLRTKKDLILPEFLQYQLQSFHLRVQIEIPARSTSGVNNINTDEVKNLKITLPSIEEQKEVIKKIKQFLVSLEKNEHQYGKARSYADKIEQSILAKAFRGELFS